MAATLEEFKRMIESCNEATLYLLIEGLGGFVWRMNHDMNKGNIPNSPGIRKDIRDAQDKMEAAVATSTRFGVTEPWTTRENPLTKEMQKAASDDYWLWYRWWNAWDKSLSNDQYKQMDRDLEAGVNLDKWRPAGDWRKAAEPSKV